MPLMTPQMRSKLAACAFELFADGGFRNVNLDAIAARAGVTKGSLYWHYRSKKELIVAACGHYYRTWQQRAHAEIAAANEPWEQLRGVLRYSVKTCLLDEKNRVFTSEIFAMSLQDPDIRAGWAAFYDTVRELYVGLVEACRCGGRITAEDPRRAVDWMLATMEGIKQRAAFETRICAPEEQEAIVAGLMQIASHGVDLRERVESHTTF